MTVSDDDISTMLDEELLARRTKVMFLRNAGATWAAVSKETGVSIATCRKDYQVVCRDINNEQPADVVARHRAVIFDIQRANYPAMMRGDKDAAATILRALDREAKLLGLDAPTRILAGVSDVEFANEAARLIERITQLDPTTMKELGRATNSAPRIIDAESADLPADQAGHPQAAPLSGPGANADDGDDDWSNIA
ncbi:Rnase E [Mycobacterium phage Heath]|uniref:RNaseE n=2 Tax=Coopervirus TaxID=1982898 RepID=A0A7G8LFV9_9CAUD|nr:Rnase E [Mycobacterium phage Heath]QNJ56131.1 RNaseE [Mycobacterium phage Heath]QQV92961.1 RNaseE [Mycobacterium phage Hydro]